MVDFSKLLKRSPEERQRDRDEADREYEQETLSRDDAERDRKSVKAITLTLEHEPEMRGLMSGERAILFRGTQPGQSNASVSSYTVPVRTERSEDGRRALDGMLREMGGGDKITLTGQWSKRHWKTSTGAPKSAWEFNAQHMVPGEMSLEKAMEKVRQDRGEVVAAPGIEEKRVNQARSAAMGRDGGVGV